MSKSNIPCIRFEGFSGEWEEKKLGDMSESFEYGLNASAKEYDGKNKYIRITDINEDSHVFNTDDLTSPNTDLNLAENYKLKLGDILFARTGASVGKTYIYKKEDGLVYYAGFLIRARTKKEINSIFIFQNTLTKRYDKFIRLTSQRSGQPGVNAQEYSSFQIHIPKIIEQTKIGNYFQKLDKLIEQKEKKYQKLKQFKKAMLDKMFPKNRANTPEIRFNGFSWEWEEKKLGEIYNFQYGQFNTNPSDGGIYSVYGANGKIGGYSKFNAEHSVVIGHMGEYAGSVLWEEGKHFVTYNGTISTPKDSKFNSIYGYYMLYKLNIEKICAGSGQPFLSYKTLQNITVIFTVSIAEQTKIGNYFQKLDTLIDLQLQEIKKLKNIKKASLAKMFV